MFDNPNEELKRLEDQLLQAEMNDEEFEAIYDEIYEEFGTLEEDFLEDVPVSNIRNYANNYGRGQQPREPAPRRYQPNGPAYGGDMDLEMDEDRYVSAGKEKSLRGLVLFICLECLGIAAVVLWWLFRMM